MQESDVKSAGSQSRAKILIRRYNEESSEWTDHPAEDPAESIAPATASQAFILRKVQASPSYGELEITNPHLWDLLKDLLGAYPWHFFKGSPVTLRTPFEDIIYEWNKLEEATKKESEKDVEKQARSDLKLLLNTIAGASGDAKLDTYLKARTSATGEDASITFQDL